MLWTQMSSEPATLTNSGSFSTPPFGRNLRNRTRSTIPRAAGRQSVLWSMGTGMNTSKVIHVVSCHAEVEVRDEIVGGVTPPPGNTLWEQRSFIAEDDVLRRFVPPRQSACSRETPRAQMGWIIMEPEDTPPMSGSNSICVATVLLDTGILPMSEPETHLALEARGGLVEIRAQCRNGKAERIKVTNVPSRSDC